MRKDNGRIETSRRTRTWPWRGTVLAGIAVVATAAFVAEAPAQIPNIQNFRLNVVPTDKLLRTTPRRTINRRTINPGTSNVDRKFYPNVVTGKDKGKQITIIKKPRYPKPERIIPGAAKVITTVTDECKKRYPPRRCRPKPGIVVPVVPVVPTDIVTAPPGSGQPPGIVGSPDGGLPPGGGSQAAPLRRPGTGVPPANENRFVPDEVVIEVASSLTNQAAEALARRHRLARLESYSFALTGTTLLRWRITDRRDVRTVIRALEAERVVMSVQANFLHMTQQSTDGAAPTDIDPSQYSALKLDLKQAHTLARGEKILIAVIDSSIDGAHPELVNVIADRYDAIGKDDKPHDHGTAIAGAIAAKARLLGVAPSARILAIRSFDPKGNGAEGTTFYILKGLDWAVAKNARIINMSFAGPYDAGIARALAAARAKGAILIAAAGNAGPHSPPLFPASDSNVIAVTATDVDDKLFVAANRGRHIAVAAPGVDLLLPAPENTYKMTSGTSFAAAHVSGLVALLLERRPDLDQAGVLRALVASARDLGPRGRDTQFGAGLVNAYQALLKLGAPPAAAAAQVRPAANSR